MRLFVAIECNELRDYFCGIQEEIREYIHGNFAKDFHITLKFLGEVSDAREIIENLKKVEFSSFSLQFSHIGFFPSQSRIHVVWVGIKNSKEIIELQNEVRKYIGGVRNEDHRFHPHVTLARVKNVSQRDKLLKIQDKKFEKELLVKRFVLFKSDLTKYGPVYSEVEEFLCK